MVSSMLSHLSSAVLSLAVLQASDFGGCEHGTGPRPGPCSTGPWRQHEHIQGMSPSTVTYGSWASSTGHVHCSCTVPSPKSPSGSSESGSEGVVTDVTVVAAVADLRMASSQFSRSFSPLSRSLLCSFSRLVRHSW
eukprot:scaffold117769_cov63-Phaeocystis_antarctica.AAC.5